VFAKSRVGGNGYFFYDINAKANYIINSNNELFFTFYTGQDKFSFQSLDEKNTNNDRVFRTNWGNTLAGLAWRQNITGKLSHVTGLVSNSFNLDSRFGFRTNSFLFTSGLQDLQVKSDWTYNRSNWLKLKFGGQYIWHQFTPGAGGFTAGVQEFKSKISNQYAREAAAYISADINLTPNLNIIAGLRYSYFNQVGPTERVIYDADNVPTGEVEKFSAGKALQSIIILSKVECLIQTS
jgi:outer membrane receptor for ferrienterochelin and colicin